MRSDELESIKAGGPAGVILAPAPPLLSAADDTPLVTNVEEGWDTRAVAIGVREKGRGSAGERATHPCLSPSSTGQPCITFTLQNPLDV